MTFNPKNITPLSSILPEDPLLMMGSGPVPIPAQVAQANSKVINHLGSTMNKVINQVQIMARYVFQSDTNYIFGVAGAGSATMEMAISNLVEPDDHVLCVCNGYFSARMAEMTERVGGIVTAIKIPDLQSACPELIEQTLKSKPFKVITIVHGETSNTVLNTHIEKISKIAKSMGILVIVDAICTLSTMPLPMKEWGLDAVITGGQKGLSSIPGVSLIAFSDDAWQHILQRKTKTPQWCLDARLANNFWNENQYHYTAPVSGILALHEALKLICDEKLENRFKRHLVCANALQNSIESLGLKLYVPKASRLNSVIGILLPENITAKQILKPMSEKHNVEISGAFGLPIIRIGQMGEQSRAHNLFRTVHALGHSFNHSGFAVDIPAAMAALEKGLTHSPNNILEEAS